MREKMSKESEKALRKHGSENMNKRRDQQHPGLFVMSFPTYTARQSSTVPQKQRRSPAWQRPAERCDPKITVKICSV